MKKLTKLISLVLALVMLAAAFVGCGGATETPEGTTEEKKAQATESGSKESEETTEEEWKPDIEQKNYGEEFYLWVMGDVNPGSYYWVKESANETMSDAVYGRQEKIRQHLGVEIVFSGTESEDRYSGPFKTAVKNKDGSVDLLISHVYYGIEGFITGNYLTDFSEVAEFNLDADYWKLQFMENIGLNGHLYLGFSDYNILYTHVITFNKELLAKYEDQLDETVYSMVDNYRWTLDKMIWLASLAYVDTTSDGKTDDDTYGLTCYQSVPFVGFMQASNIQIVDMDDSGNYVLGFYTDQTKQRMSDLVDKLYNLTRSDFTCFKNNWEFPQITSGRALMQISRSLDLENYLSSEVDFGVLPFPMYDENQKDVGYRHLQWGGYQCIPSYLDNSEMTYETIELLSYYSDDVNIAYYEKLLGKKVADAPDDRRMLDVVWDSVCSDFGQTYFTVFYNTNVLYALPTLTREGTTENLSSYVAQRQNTVNRNLKKFIARFK